MVNEKKRTNAILGLHKTDLILGAGAIVKHLHFLPVAPLWPPTAPGPQGLPPQQGLLLLRVP